jgi:hypothetical protein
VASGFNALPYHAGVDQALIRKTQERLLRKADLVLGSFDLSTR